MKFFLLSYDGGELGKKGEGAGGLLYRPFLPCPDGGREGGKGESDVF